MKSAEKNKKKGKKTHLKLYIWKEERISKAGHRQWSRKTRPYVRNIVFKPVARIDIPVKDIDTKAKIMQLCEERFGEGIWIVRGGSGGKTSKRFKWVRLAKVTIIETPQGYKSSITDTWRLSRYKWFWKDG